MICTYKVNELDEMNDDLSADMMMINMFSFFEPWQALLNLKAQPLQLLLFSLELRMRQPV